MQSKIKKKFILFLLLPGIFSCKQQQAENRLGTFAPNMVAAKGYMVPKDSMAVPKNNPVDESKLKKIAAGNPFIVPFNNNIHIAGVPKVVTVGKPKVITPGTDTFLLPKVIPAIEIPFPAGIPEVFIAKEMTFKSSFSMFGKQHGLKHHIVTCLLEDKSGNLWFGTAGGVSKYDGRSFTNYTEKEGLINNDVRSIMEDRSGNIWFGTLGGGISKFDGSTFTNITEKEGILNNNVRSIHEDKSGNIWFGTAGGVSKYNGKSFTQFTAKEGLINNDVNTILEDRTGNLWFGTAGGVAEYDGVKFMNITEHEGLINNVVYSILEDKSGNIWLGTEAGVSKFNGPSLPAGQECFTNFTDKEGLINNRVFSILEDRSGNIWFGTFNGVSKYDSRSLTDGQPGFSNFTEQEGLSNNDVYTMLEDKSGNIWFGTAGGGVSKYDRQPFTHYTEMEGLSKNYVYSLLKDKSENIWFGTWGGGVSKFDGKSFTQFGEKEGLNNHIRSILQDKSGNIWFATYKGVVRYDKHSFVYFTEKDGLINNDVNSIIEDKSGNLWIGTAGGISKYNGQSFLNFTKKEGLTHNNIFCLQEDRSGNIWFGTAGGVTKYDGVSFIHFTEKGGLSNNAVNSILEDKSGNFWFGTVGGGISKYNGYTMTNFTEKEGLISNFIASILEDKYGNIWLGTRFGLSEFTPEKQALFSEKAKTNIINENDIFFKNYSYADGFLGIGCNSNAIIESTDGTIWIGTNTGVTVFNPRERSGDTIPPNIQLTAIKLFNENISWPELHQKEDSSFLLGNGIRVSNFHFDGLSKWYNLPEHLSLSYKNNFVTFDFIGIIMSQSQNVKYQYKLEGIDKYWSALTSNTSAPYGNLPQGTYTFKVKAMNDEGYWSTESNYTFTIRPPWWKTWWFRILAIASLSAFVFSIGRFIVIYQLRKQRVAMEKQLAVQYERQRISSDLHDEIGSTLSSINIYAGLAKKETNKDSYLDAINQNVSEVINKLDEMVWSINPKNETTTSIVNRLRSYAEPITQAREISFEIENELPDADIKLTAETTHDIYLVAKELINNAIKHSQCKHIRVQFSRQQKKLLLIVEDDGIGFDETSIPKERHGLGNIKQRVTAMKGNIHSDNENGTRITISIPV